jgi:hypothetical protein
MRTKFSCISFVLIVLIANKIFPEDNKSGIVYGDNWAYIVIAPDGWTMDSNSLFEQGIYGLFYEEGKKLGTQYNTPIIYIVQFPLNTATDDELNKFAESDINNYIANGSKVEKIDGFYKNTSNLYITYNVDLPNGRYECFVFTRYKALCLIIILNANSKQERDKLFPKMIEVINSISFMDKN